MELTENISYLEGSKAIVFFSKKTSSLLPKSSIVRGGALEYCKWFDASKNLEPSELLQVVMNNNMAPSILATQAKFTVGEGIRTYEEVIVDGKVKKEVKVIPAIEKFIENNNLNEVLYRAAKDYFVLGNFFLQGVFNSLKKVVKVVHTDASTVRLSAPNSKMEHDYFVCSNWKSPIYDENDPQKGNCTRIAGMTERNPFKDNTDEWKQEFFPHFMYHGKEYNPGSPYYGIPGWYGTRKWLELSNLIPEWHINTLKNGHSIRYMVEISEQVFAGVKKEDLKEAKIKLQNEINEYLAGIENAGKSLFINMPHQFYTEKGLIRITPIDNNLNDAAYTQLFQNSNNASTSGFAMSPTLAGIETAGKLSSGSEIRNAHEMWVSVHAERPRSVLIHFLDQIKIINGWDKEYPTLKFGFENARITTLAESPTGVQQTLV